MMCAALGGAGLTAFLILRERNFTQAVLVSQSLIVAAGLSHPMAAGYACGLLALTLYSDWKRIRPAACTGGGGALCGRSDRVGAIYHEGAARFHAAIRRQCGGARTAPQRPDGHHSQPGCGALPSHVRHGPGYPRLQPYQDPDSGCVCGRRSGSAAESGDPSSTKHAQSVACFRRDLDRDDCAGPRSAASVLDSLCAVDDLVDRGGGRVLVGPALCTALGAGGRSGWWLCLVQVATTGRRVSQRAYSTIYLTTTDYLKTTRRERA